MSNLLPVTQADRDAVQNFQRAMLDKLMVAVKDEDAGRRMGEDEGDAGTLVQAFARHRIETKQRFSARNHETASPAPGGQGVSGEVADLVWRAPVNGELPHLPDGMVYGWRTTSGQIWWGDGYPVPARRFSLDASSCDAVLVAFGPAPSCTPGEVERILAATVYDIADSEPIPTPAEAYEWCVMVAQDAQARIAAISPQGLDAKERGE